MSFDTCRCGSEAFIARTGTETTTVLDAAGEVVDRTSSDTVEDVECATCGRVVRDRAELDPEEVDALLEDAPEPAPHDFRAWRHTRGSVADDGTNAAIGATTCVTAKRLALLVAALLFDNEEFHADVYERHFGEDNRPSLELGLVEFTEDGRVEILADGREYVLRVESKPQ